MNYLPPIKVTQGQPFAYEMTVTGQDWTGITGTVTIKEIPGGDELVEKAVTATALGVVSFSLTAAETLLLTALPVLGYRATGVFQIAMSDGQLFQGNVGVAGVV